MPQVVTRSQDAENLDRAGGRRMRLLLDGESTDGTLAVLGCEMPAAASGRPLHRHPGSDETFLVQDGELLLHLDGTTHRLAAGDVAFVPRGSAHTFATGERSGARFVAVHTPGGFERMHREVHRAERDTGRVFGPADIMPIAARHDWALAGPPLLPTGRLASTPAGPASPSRP